MKEGFKERFTMPTDSRPRKCCITCGSVCIIRKKRMYKCPVCHAVFQKPALKEVKTHNGLPACLIATMEKKKKQEAPLAGDIE